MDHNPEVKKEAAENRTESLPFSDLDIPAPPRPDGMELLRGVIVDYNLPSLKGILQPLTGPDGGEHKDLLQFDISQLQCEGFRAVNKWTVVEYSRVEENDIARAMYITAENNKLINFDEDNFMERERNLLLAHRYRMLKRTRHNPSARKQN